MGKVLRPIAWRKRAELLELPLLGEAGDLKRERQQAAPAPTGRIESAHRFAVALAESLGLQLDRLMHFTVNVGPDQQGIQMVTVSAKYAVPRGAGEAAAVLVRSFNLVPGSDSVEEAGSVDVSSSLKTGLETLHRAAPCSECVRVQRLESDTASLLCAGVPRCPKAGA